MSTKSPHCAASGRLASSTKAIDLNVVILPDDDVRRRVIRYSRQIARRYEVAFILDDHRFLPHLTLYQARFPAANLDKICEVVSGVAERTRLERIRVTGFSSLAGFVFYQAATSLALTGVHRQLTRLLSPLRGGLLLPIHERMLGEAIPVRKKRCIRKWGNPMCMNEFEPHITLSRLVNQDEAPKAISLLEDKPMQFCMTDLTLTTLGPHGTCPKVCKRFTIPNK